MNNGSNVAFIPTALTMHVSSESISDDSNESQERSNGQASSESISATYKEPMVKPASYSPANTVGTNMSQVNFSFEPYINQEQQQSAVKIPNNFRRTIDPKTKDLIEADLIVLVSGICKKYGVNLSSTFKFDNENSTDQSLTLGVMFSVVDAVGRDQLGRDFLRFCDKFGLQPWMYGEVIQYHGEDYVVSGLDLCRKRVKISNHNPSVKLVKPEEIINYFNEVKADM